MGLEDRPADAEGRAPERGRLKNRAVAIGSEPSSAATISVARITIGSPAGAVAEAAPVSAASLSSPPHAPKNSTPTRTSIPTRTSPTNLSSRTPSSCDEATSGHE